MKNSFWITPLFIAAIVSGVTIACKKEEPAKLAVVSTTSVSNITTTTATCGGSVISNGGTEILANGVCWSTTGNPSITDSKTIDPAGIAQFTSSISGLSAGTTYHIRAYATNSVGTSYGADLSFSTLGEPADGITQPATCISATGATLNGIVNANYLPTIVTFEYGLTTSYGNTITAAQNPIEGNSLTNVSTDISGLAAGTTYHFRVKTENSMGIVYGGDQSFLTLGNVPSCETLPSTAITASGSTLNGNVNANYSSTSVIFEYGLSTNYGNTITATQSPVEGNSITTVSVIVSELTAGTTYHFRIKTENSLGITYGNDETFTTTFNGITGTVSDIDGNEYKTIGIGMQMWMAENLKTTKLNDGSDIASVEDIPIWVDLTTPAFCYYDNDSALYENLYGILYNWVTVGTSKLCPKGWHVPSEADWAILITYLGGLQNAGGKLKESGITHWQSPNEGATNESGFTALPGGTRFDAGIFFGIEEYGYFWSATEQVNYAYFIDFWYTTGQISGYGYTPKKMGLSVRCLMDY